MKRKKTCIGNLMFATSIKHLLLSCFTCALVVAAASTQQQNSYHHLSRHMMRQIPIGGIASSTFNHRSKQQQLPAAESTGEFTDAVAGLTHQYDTRQETVGSPGGASSYRSSDQDEGSGLTPDTANAGSGSSVGLGSSSNSDANRARSASRIGGNSNGNSNADNEATDETNEGNPEGSSSFENSDASADHDESADNSQEIPERNVFIDRHNSQLQAMHDLFERRQLNNHNPLQSSQELSPMTIGLDAVTGIGSPFNMPPFSVPNHQDGPPPMPLAKPPMANADNIDQGLGPTLPFGLNHLPHLLGFQSHPFDGPQRGDQSAHTNHHAALPPPSPVVDQESGPSQKVWPKIFRFTDGRINLSEFEKQKKIRLSSKNQHNNDNHIESAPIMFDGRQLKRKSFLILHGGVFSK